MFVFSHPHWDPGSAVLNILELLDAPARDPSEELTAVVWSLMGYRHGQVSLLLTSLDRDSVYRCF